MLKINFHIISIFPGSFESYFKTSILKRAEDNGLIKINLTNPRNFTKDKRKTVDDSPYGGGPGMVIKVEAIYKAVGAITKKLKNRKTEKRIILFSTRGKKFTQRDAKRLAKYKNIIMICGRYEGVDERVAEHIADEEISIGDYILSGGELPAMIVTEAVSRHIPQVLGNRESLEDIKGSYPVYTRPATFKAGNKKWKVPEELLSGNHKGIEKWRKTSAKKQT